jgi:uncharacterized DUF497 family protein
MTDNDFEWNDAKASLNVAQHGVSFEVAKLVFRDPFAIEWLDDREDYGEDRFAIIGIAEGRLLYVAFTIRGQRTRIISARGAEPFEQRQYHEDNA